MKVNIVTTLIAVFMSALIAYAFYEYSPEEVNVLVSIGSLVCLLPTSIFAMGIQLTEGTPANMRILAILSFILMLVSNIICAATAASTPVYVIINGAILLVFVLLTYLIIKSKQ